MHGECVTNPLLIDYGLGTLWSPEVWHMRDALRELLAGEQAKGGVAMVEPWMEEEEKVEDQWRSFSAPAGWHLCRHLSWRRAGPWGPGSGTGAKMPGGRVGAACQQQGPGEGTHYGATSPRDGQVAGSVAPTGGDCSEEGMAGARHCHLGGSEGGLWPANVGPGGGLGRALLGGWAEPAARSCGLPPARGRHLVPRLGHRVEVP